MKRIIYIGMLLAAVSCTFDNMRLQRPEELGTDKDEYMIGTEEGSTEVKIYTNMPGSAYIAGDASWVRLSTSSFTSDCVIMVRAEENKGRNRMALLVLDTEARQDTVYIKQHGTTEEFLDIKSSAVTAESDDEEVSVPASTNVAAEHFIFRARYISGQEGWLNEARIDEGAISLSCLKNESTASRSAVVVVGYDNGWGEVPSQEFRVIQTGTGDTAWIPVDFDEIKAQAGEAPSEITESYTLTGHVISDIDSGNAGENTQLTSTEIDYSPCRKTAYIQSLDGTSGFMVEFKTEEDNILRYNSLVTICIEGTVLTKKENPLRYMISDLQSSSVLSCEEVDKTQIKSNRRRISQLTDNDIYTRVTITDCEFPIRKGSLTPVHEGYTSATERHRTTKFPTMIRDIEGRHMYMYTNTTCPYRRDGHKIGYGQGEVTGVLVHEKYRRFIDMDSPDVEECGNIGQYQLRHMTAEDINFSEEESFSEIICEWRYVDTINPDGSWVASLGKGTMTHSTAPDTRFLTSGMTASANDYSYLGPIYSTDTHANENGFGIEEIDDIPAVKKEQIGKGSFSATSANTSKIAMSWRNNQWYKNNQYQYWLISFSTKDITTDVLSMQLSVLNTSGGKCPNEWKVEWAESKDAETWTHIADYNVPDIVRDVITEPWQSPGYKPIDIKLPSEMLNKAEVYIRLMPRSRKGSNVVYLDSNYNNGSYSAMNYFAIRYNR